MVRPPHANDPVRAVLMNVFKFLPFLSLLVACGGGGGPSDDPGGGGGSVIIQKAIASGDLQTGAVADTLAQPIVVTVSEDGLPAAGRVVLFTPLANSGVLVPAVDTTGADGSASAIWILGNSTGLRQARITSTGVGGSPLTFSATAVAGPAATLLSDGGQAQVQEVGLQFPQALAVRVVDQFGNSVSNVVVTWARTTGSAVLSAAADTTGSNGRATVSVVAGDTVGGVTVTASVPSLAGSPVQFALDVAPAAAHVTVSSNFFSPASVSIPVGGAVKWIWNSGTHNVTQQTGPAIFPASPTQDAGTSFGPVVFAVAGVYTYECSLHSGMTGTIDVGVASAPPQGVER
jgi:plastocyanin